MMINIIYPCFSIFRNVKLNSVKMLRIILRKVINKMLTDEFILEVSKAQADFSMELRKLSKKVI